MSVQLEIPGLRGYNYWRMIENGQRKNVYLPDCEVTERQAIELFQHYRRGTKPFSFLFYRKVTHPLDTCIGVGRVTTVEPGELKQEVVKVHFGKKEIHLIRLVPPRNH